MLQTCTKRGDKQYMKKVVLLVDDDPLMLRTIKSLLSEKYAVVCLNSGKALLKYAKSRTVAVPDLILLDYVMPSCDGPTCVQMLRDDERYKDVKIVFITGVAQQDKVKEAMALKPSGYLVKPVSPVLLMETLENLLGGV